MADIPRRAAHRTAKLAGLPLGAAGRLAAGWGKRLTGQDATSVNSSISIRTAEQLFAVLGELKGGAMKFGQALSVFEAAVPEEMSGPYREALTKLQSAAPPMSAESVHRVLDEQLGTGWRDRFREFDETPTASASIGQVHRAVWHDGREVAVKVQYPGADEALRSDLRQLMRFSRLFQSLAPGAEIKPLLTELQDRMVEELDYRIEADNQRAFAKEFSGDPEVVVPKVVASSPKVAVTEWITGTPFSKIIAEGSREQRDLAGRLLAEFTYSTPSRIGMLHADPHPGNFMLLPCGRLGVIDFGAVSRLPGGMPETFGTMIRLALDDRPEELLELMRAERFIRPEQNVQAEDVLAYLAPFVDPARTERFHFTRAWLQHQAERVSDLRSPDFHTSRSLNLPPDYLLIHRVTMGAIGILCQLDAELDAREIITTYQPGFRDQRPTA
ncbi:AarF/ABC1/UbiB kinase family protein [Saccharopolyspora halophila]|uniref:AarF/ABC1/UbiB kinase family protein n=1 Tax=Saccharopolyspora halophila TaxID=405551 RepID=A0ABN3FLD7_9PSEU